MDYNIIRMIELKRNELLIKIKKRKIFSTKLEKELLKKYDKLLLDMYKKISN